MKIAPSVVLLFAASLFFPSSALAQGQAVVESIEPHSGPPSGGTVVTIRGKNLANIAPPATAAVRPLCTPCPAQPPEVLFGGKPGVLESYSDVQIVVKTPPSAGGLYDVTVGGLYTRGVVLPLAFQYGNHSHPRLLVPLVADALPGGYGSVWATELVGRNNNDAEVPVFQFIGHVPSGTPWTGGFARTTFRPELQHNGAAFLYHWRTSSFFLTPLAFSLRIRDLSRQADSWGTEIPLIYAEDAFVGRPVDLLNVPYEPESRLTLRVYDLDGETGGEVPVLVFDNESERLLGSTTVRFPDGPYLDMPVTPGYIVLDPKSLIGDAANVQRIRIQVGERFHEKRLWSFVSVTDLETQQVTIVTPTR